MFGNDYDIASMRSNHTLMVNITNNPYKKPITMIKIS
jgi:hypothetical protein